MNDSTTRALRLGTRRSKLAMAQSGQVAEAVRRVTGRPVELVEITTYGDTSREHLAQIGGTGVFVSALRDALLAGEIDFAVHSLKDLPTTQPDDLTLAAIPVREDPRDALIARDGLTFEQLPDGARVGTGSPRRMAQLNAWARSLGRSVEAVPIRGTSTPASASSRRVNWTRSYSPPPDSPASAVSTRRRSCCRPTWFCPPPARGTGDRVCCGQRRPRRPARRARRPGHPGRRDRRALPARRPGGRLFRTRRSTGRSFPKLSTSFEHGRPQG